MRWIARLAAVAAALLIACSGGADSTSTATPESSATPDGGGGGAGGGGATPAATAPVETESSYVALVDLGSGSTATVQDGPGVWNTWWEPGGEVVQALVLGAGQAPRTVRVALDGSVISDSTTELQARANADGSARAFGAPTGDGATFQMALEVDGERVPLQGTQTVLPVAFSPSGELLLSYSGAPAPEGEAAIVYAVHDLSGAEVVSFTNRLSAQSTTASQATWSPSGEYVATLGLDGLVAHEVATGQNYEIKSNGSTEWSPTADALLVAVGPQELDVVQIPSLERVALTVNTSGVTASFDPTGRVVAVTDVNAKTTSVFDAATGEELTVLGGMAEPSVNFGFEPVVMTDEGVAALLTEAPGCGGTLVEHPALGVRGQCLNGVNARWSPGATAVAYSRGDVVAVFDVASGSEQVVASALPLGATATLARWSEDGTHLLLEAPWGGSGWTDALP
jgi:hypothetical protein